MGTHEGVKNVTKALHQGPLFGTRACRRSRQSSPNTLLFLVPPLSHAGEGYVAPFGSGRYLGSTLTPPSLPSGPSLARGRGVCGTLRVRALFGQHPHPPSLPSGPSLARGRGVCGLRVRAELFGQHPHPPRFPLPHARTRERVIRSTNSVGATYFRVYSSAPRPPRG